MLKHKKIISAILAVAMLGAMSTSVFAEESNTNYENANTQEFCPDEDSLGHGVVDAQLPDPHMKITLSDNEEAVGGVAGGTWEWGIYQVSLSFGLTQQYVYSGLSCAEFQSRTSVKPGVTSAWITSGWHDVGEYAYVNATASPFGGNKAAYDYK